MVVIFVFLTFVAVAILVPIIQKSLKTKKIEQMMSEHAFGLKFAFPLEYQFSPGHVWLNKESQNSYKVGMDELLERFIGSPDKVFMMNTGDKVKKGEQIAVVKKGNKEIYIKSPITGEIEEINKELSDSPGMIVEDPYKKGWIYKIKSFEKIMDVNNIKTKLKAKYWLTEEMNRLKDFAMGNLPQPVAVGETLLDGGELNSGLIDHLDQKSISLFEEQFLNHE